MSTTRLPLPPDRRAVLRELAEQFNRLGSANDCEDHGSAAEADRMREEACRIIREHMEAHSYVRELLPTLQWALDSGTILTTQWWNLEDAARAWLAVTGIRSDRSD